MPRASVVASFALFASCLVVACTGDDTLVATTGGDGGNAGDGSTTTGDGGLSSDASTITQGAPITGTTPGSWTWVDFPNALCRDGSATGIGVNPSATGSTNLMIYFQGGGACFNAPTCGQNPSSFSASDFASIKAGGTGGIFSRTDTKNSVADWNMVFVPYCTGDIHVGNAPDTAVTGVGTQQFVGYANVTHYLERLLPTFPSPTHILLTGESGGGFGSALNYVHVANAYPGVKLDLLDDSGPLVPSNDTTTGIQACQVNQVISLWGLSSTLLTDCGADCSDQGNSLIGYWTHLGKTYPSAHFGLVESVADATISGFYGFSNTNCTGFASESPADFEKGLLDQRTAVASYSNMGSFLFAGTDHTSLSSKYTTRTAGGDAGGVVLEDWVSALVGGAVTNEGP